MRSGIIAAAFAATAIAVPLQERDVVTHTAVEMAYVTDYVTVTANGPAPADTQQAAAGWGGHHPRPHWWQHHPQKQHTAEPAPAPEPEPTHAPAPAPTTDWAPAPTSEAPSQPSSAPPSGAPPADYQGQVLYHHNIHRANHSAPEVKWSASLAATAQKIADSCSYGHDTSMDGGGYGQNIAAGVKGEDIGRVITNMFYDSELGDFGNQYGNPSPSGFETWGHFTQMVWINTVEVACVTKQCASLANTGGNVPPYFTVCNYGPPGNVGGQYANNVKAPLGHQNLVV